ncbi:MAG: Cobalamin adenosyltransferase family protein [Candidatus Magasanikbacteria bacterium GW2011_GWA2_37_8]|uniref:Corrinoid adenosyltransferase n=1 Tax=Candidatus Magasanikbacteria bacterium GW2011_GWA2_37_8 TaxID=1619036 RepID=A0A0G0HD94_9BACT|nr:MAG: Cobalamin adenosyltransferase family protein [Candidatus Magasanikbacteria bacterium GW2011_GWA2_37_8]
MPKIYTKTGDSGKTSLLGGKRVCKSCIEMDAIGEVDELNAFLGVVIEEVEEDFKQEKNKLINIQRCLFVVGANLAAVQTELKNIPKLKSSEITKLEKWIVCPRNIKLIIILKNI